VLVGCSIGMIAFEEATSPNPSARHVFRLILRRVRITTPTRWSDAEILPSLQDPMNDGFRSISTESPRCHICPGASSYAAQPVSLLLIGLSYSVGSRSRRKGRHAENLTCAKAAETAQQQRMPQGSQAAE
jgi:hypothetical protein